MRGRRTARQVRFDPLSRSLVAFAALTPGRDAFFEVARSEGARYLFTSPGTTELPIFDEFAEDSHGLELIMCLQEGVAVGAADGYAQATNKPSLINLHVTPGLAN